MARPVDALLSYPGEYSLRARFGAEESHRPFWNTIASIGHLLGKREGRDKLPECPSMDLSPDPVRMSGPTIRGADFLVLWGRNDHASFLYQLV